ncbi:MULTISPECIES: MarC family protein [Edaphocola]|jgi:multiple antibiotic resistance protein|uniref:MarC family protein n=1 Tax=Edaphocola TaxID=2601681 RepID=UPI000FB5DF00|nr:MULTISPECIES: MarC family protein [Edaphocola]
MNEFGQININEIVTISITLFAVIDILGSIPVLIGIKKKMGDISALTATVVSGALMILFFLAGNDILKFMGLDVSSFAIAGSIIIFILGLEMILGIEFFKPDGGSAKTGSIVPIAFPLIAGSGTLTTILSLKSAYHQYNVLIGILVNLVIIFVIIRSLNAMEKLLGPAGILVIRKFFGVILIAIAVKIFRENMHL